MTKNVEIPDVAMYEETDSELAKYHIQQALDRVQDLKEQIKDLFDEYLELKDRIDKAIEEINKNKYMIDIEKVLDILKGIDKDEDTN